MAYSSALRSVEAVESDVPQIGGIDLTRLSREIDVIAGYVRNLRASINAIHAPEIARERLPEMRGDLAAVVEATNDAANRILETAEELMFAPDGPNYRAKVEEKMIGLMEACSFQDLTGQRISRVAGTLCALEERIQKFSEAVKAHNALVASDDPDARRRQRMAERLVHGPGGIEALQQNEIDRLLA
ncbi:MAG: protein phosphatase CheZ [Bosea sp. (in: a-proteobacteria)]